MVGLVVGGDGRRLEAALVGVEGFGLDVSPHIHSTQTISLGGEIGSLLHQLVSGSSEGWNGLPAFRSELSRLQAGLVQDLLAESGIARSLVLGIGLYDPGYGPAGKPLSCGYWNLSDPICLAELIGFNIMDGFIQRDLAVGGQGGPLMALPQWLFFRTDKLDQVLLDLGRTLRLTYLPAARRPDALERILCFDVGPGTGLLDLLTTRLTSGSHGFDPGGKLAAQGRRIPELIEHWGEDPYFHRPLPRWHPYGVAPERFLTTALHLALQKNWAIQDLLCTATHFLADTVAQAIRQWIQPDLAIGRILVTGGGQQNGMLLREIAGRLPQVPLVRTSDLGLEEKGLEAGYAALLGLMCLDQVPCNIPSVTGAKKPLVLGRITPGTPQSWIRLIAQVLQWMSEAHSLRRAG